MFRKKKVGFISEVDKFLTEFDDAHPKSESQLAEINKYRHIHKLRDQSLDSDQQS